MQSVKPIRMRILAVSEWILVLPATILLAAGAVRLMQPREYEPARTSWIIFEWTTAHISPSGAALLFLGLPALALILGCSTGVAAWRNDQQFRGDMAQALSTLRRHWSMVMVSLGTLVAAMIVTFAVVHMITD